MKGQETSLRMSSSDSTAAARLGRLSLEHAGEVGVRTSPISKKRPASSEVCTADAPALVKTYDKAIAIRTSCAASKYIKRPTAEETITACPPLTSEPSVSATEGRTLFPDPSDPRTPEEFTEGLKRRRRPTETLYLDIVQSIPGLNAARSLRQADYMSQDEFTAEIKGIYAALVMVEAKCIKLDAAHMSASANLSFDQWQALFAVHRTLLYEHHDFLSASQHPSTSSSLRKLATKYSMPARMWKHGIHSFLEVLRRRLPDSLDYMLQFIYLAYQTVTLLYETVPSFEDTWIECLGDLARYRMAVEEIDMRDREVWGGVARDWYSKTSNRNPDVGRLYHHLGILARPNAIQQAYYYCRALTCVQPFESAMESLSSLLSPLTKVEPERAVIPYVDETDSMFLCLHAKMLASRSRICGTQLHTTISTYRVLLDTQIRRQALKWKDHGVFIAVTNISACFGYGYYDNCLTKAYRKGLKESGNGTHDSISDDSLYLLSSTLALVLSRENDFNVLPHVHTILAFLWSIYNLAVGPVALITKVLNSIPWGKIVDFLNSFIKTEPIEDRVADAGRRGSFLQGAPKPLPEDYLLRGLVWCRDYFVSGWFDEKHDEESRLLELPSTNKVRIDRVMRLSICLSQHA
ncbi:hypothetical protein E4T50_14374 [Aureobasidium sp. EXF-12298]|nr:hypothetical protein E4T50_14374 [Aureobasidium sp. EXF-12298]KAI4770057.1 hypothetical protein E4T52_14923 [Aureobasidium sp. EXF-3400]